MADQPKKAGKEISWTRRGISLVVLAVLLYVVYLFFSGSAAVFRPASGSMEPAMHPGERWLMTQPSGGVYRVGDIVVFEHAGSSDARLAKRIVAIGPAKVALKKGLLYVDGQPSPPPGIQDAPVQLPDNSWDVPAGEVFVAGDNRAESLDSRDYGPISRKSLHGVLSRKL